MTKMSFMVVLAVALASVGTARGDTYTVNAGDTQTLDSVTNTTRFTKSGVVTGTQIIVR